MTGGPYRLVDRDNQGWLATRSGYVPDPASEDLERRVWTLEDIGQSRGPWRPVLPVTDEDESVMTAAFARCGRKAVATLAAAIEQVFHKVRQAAGGLNNPAASSEHARRTLLAGRAGSWESHVLIEVMLFGNGLNLAGNRRLPVDERRTLGPARRVDREQRDVMAGVIGRWVADPDRYTEVAETLAGLVSSYADRQPEGWRAVADQWLQPEALSVTDFRACYRLLYSQSEHFDSGLL